MIYASATQNSSRREGKYNFASVSRVRAPMHGVFVAPGTNSHLSLSHDPVLSCLDPDRLPHPTNPQPGDSRDSRDGRDSTKVVAAEWPAALQSNIQTCGVWRFRVVNLLAYSAKTTP
ncbi:hypothetical protein FHL15_000984 [Xylaria flabelliformis]|uniref:Uncharacterized protein n=1 Tax=Xylaria flabelliformis TaxID=2512241 RepID=A0A553IDS4_9PEZI|nr:hypothetical protein FHL15_000984 [Xylaria flabelliformis]